VAWRGVHWWPLPEASVTADIPNEIAIVYREAARALAADCPRAAVVMARRTLEAVADEKQAKGKTLAERLQDLHDRGILHPSLADWVKEVRQVGNAAAHYDPMDEVSTEDAKQIVAFSRELLRFIYELPAELTRRRAST